MQDKKVIEILTEGEVSIVSFLSPSLAAINDVDAMSKTLRSFVNDNQPKKVIVDFTGVRFFSSQVLGLLVEMWKTLKDYDGRMVISGIMPELGRVFKITNLDSIFEFYPDKKSAVAALVA
jgi:anti-sigma B factor antagonist